MDKYKFLYLGAALMLTACGGDDPGNDPDNPGQGSGSVTEVTDVRTIVSGTFHDIYTDQATYAPGQAVTFTMDRVPESATVRYRQGSKVIDEKPLTAKTWTWTPPSTDYTGYMVDVYTLDGNTETILSSIAVDVSSDWGRYPRYGFVATFDASKLPEGVIESEMAYLNRCHINGVQFQDWHNKHHWPLGGTRDKLLDVYKDIANRDTYTSVVKRYIEVQHAYRMKSIFYNLCFGVLSDGPADGVKEEWYIFKNPNRGDKDAHVLHSSWKSDIYLVDPGNAEWQNYIAQRNDDVYVNIDFDGYQIDQLGYRGDRYDYNGNKVNLPKGYGLFIDAMKKAHPDKSLIMNAVASYGASQIAGSGKVDFCYNEVWGDEDQFSNLHTIIKANEQYSNGAMRTVFAAYMNYDLAGRTTGNMNTPGVLLTDAVMMALGGSHLELGPHMLSREYFPAAPLAMTPELREAMIHYYDFMTAYQTMLRGTTTADEFTPSLTTSTAGVTLAAWPPKQGSVTTYSRHAGQADVIHLLNFRGIDNLSWRDLDGTRKAPLGLTNLNLTIETSKAVKDVWVASPDQHGGVPCHLAYKQEGKKLTVTVPSLKYWTMLVIE